MKGQAGYSLFEVLIAFAVMALVLAALLPGQVRFIAQANDASDALLAQDFAYSRLARLGLSEPAIQGVNEYAYGPWQVRETAEEVLDPALGYMIEVAISSRSGQQLAVAHSFRPNYEE